jgi:hypothetical protein
MTDGAMLKVTSTSKFWAIDVSTETVTVLPKYTAVSLAAVAIAPWLLKLP